MQLGLKPRLRARPSLVDLLVGSAGGQGSSSDQGAGTGEAESRRPSSSPVAAAEGGGAGSGLNYWKSSCESGYFSIACIHLCFSCIFLYFLMSGLLTFSQIFLLIQPRPLPAQLTRLQLTRSAGPHLGNLVGEQLRRQPHMQPPQSRPPETRLDLTGSCSSSKS